MNRLLLPSKISDMDKAQSQVLIVVVKYQVDWVWLNGHVLVTQYHKASIINQDFWM